MQAEAGNQEILKIHRFPYLNDSVPVGAEQVTYAVKMLQPLKHPVLEAEPTCCRQFLGIAQCTRCSGWYKAEQPCIGEHCQIERGLTVSTGRDADTQSGEACSPVTGHRNLKEFDKSVVVPENRTPLTSTPMHV